MSEYQQLIQKLDQFIRKYYQNRIIQGILISASIYLAFFLIVTSAEYFSHFSTTVRTILFYFVIFLLASVFVQFILIPVFGYFKIGKVISHKQAAEIISQHFTEIEDRLLNILELANLNDNYLYSQELIFASIDQKIKNIGVVKFTNAISKKRNYRFAKILGVVSFIFIVILIVVPSLITEGTVRIVKHNTYFEPEAPFHFVLLNDSLYVQKGDDYEVNVSLDGKYVPENVILNIGNNSVNMKKNSKSTFSYIIRNINNSLKFSFQAEDVYSQTFDLSVLPSPLILDFTVSYTVPAYTGETGKILKNTGDITIPCGSVVKWNFKTSDIEKLSFVFNDSIVAEAKENKDEFNFEKYLKESCRYAIAVSNKYFSNNDLIRYSISVIPDLFPNINVISVKDSLHPTVFYYNGNINDDYGFSKLAFIFTINGKRDSTIQIPYIKSLNNQDFYFAFDFSSISLESSDRMEYYFEVWDNDGVNGSKSSKSSVFEFKAPSSDELQEMNDEANKSIESKLSETMKLAKNIRKEIDQLKEKNVNENLSTWEKTKKMENINQMNNQIQQMLEQLSHENQTNNELQNTFSQESEEILKKQEQIEDLLKELMTEELQKLFDELNELMKEFDKDKFNDMSEKLDMSYKELSEQLDKNLEILKRFQLEEKITQTIENLRNLAKEQERLSEQVKDKNADKNDLLEQQKKQQEKFEKLSEEYKDTKKQNNELKEPMKLDDFQKETNEINQEMQQGSENMNNGNMKKASGNQKNSSKKMSDLADSMESMMQMEMQQQQEENMDDIRQILENLLTFSFTQESLMQQVNKMDERDPKYNKVVAGQKDLADDYTIIKDSLLALSARTPQISTAVSKEMYTIEKKMSESQDYLDKHLSNETKTSQQYVMTSANNLTLLLSEILNQMQQQMSMQMPGMQQCQKKQGKGSPSMSQMKGMQESMKQQLQDMIQKMKSGEGQGKQQKDAINKQLAKMLAQQEIFQKMMKDMMSNSSLSNETQKIMSEIKNLIEQNENDLVNKNISAQTLQRQNQIVTRLLEAEKSDFQREIDKKRLSHEAKNEILRNPEEIFQYKKPNSNFSELLNIQDLKMTNFYRNKYKEYFMNLNK